MQKRPILVIDNDAASVKLVAGALRPLGYEVISAASGDAGLKMAKESSPALIFVNLAVPNTNGLKICTTFMSIIDAPLVLLTLREGKYDPRYKSQYGIVEFLKKPINPHELTAMVDEFAPLGAVAESVEAEETSEWAIPEEEAAGVAPAEVEEAGEWAIPEEETAGAAPAEVEEAGEWATPEEETAGAAPAEVEEAGEWAIPEEEAAGVAPAEVEEAGEWAIPEEETAGAAPAEVEEAGEWAIPEEETTEAAPAEAEEAGEWAIPEEETPSAAPATTETEVGEWSVPEETPSEAASFEEEAPKAEDLDWGSLDEEPAGGEKMIEDPGMPEKQTSTDKTTFDFEEEAAPVKKPFTPEETAEFPAEEKEYEVRPAALERAKRRKSRSGLLIPLLAVLVVCAVGAGVFFFFIAGKEKLATPAPTRPPVEVAKKKEPSPPPPAPEKRPVPVEPAPVAEKPAPMKPAPVAQPTKPAPVAQPTKPAPVAQPTKPAPVAQPTKPAPVAQKPAPVKPAAGKTYYVQFGAFRSQDNARKLQASLKNSGYDVFIKEVAGKGQPLYLVLLSDKFTDQWVAFKQARQIKDTANLSTSVHSE